MLSTSNFVYEIVVEAPNHTKANIKQMFGSKGGFIPEYREDVWAREELGPLFQDAICHCLMMKVDHLVKEGNTAKDDFCKRMDEKVKHYEKLRDSLKYIRKEKP